MSNYLEIAKKARRKSCAAANKPIDRGAEIGEIGSRKISVREQRASSTSPTHAATKATEATKATARQVASESTSAKKAIKAMNTSTSAGFFGLTVGEALKEINRRDSGPAKNARLYRRGELSKEKAIEYITCAILHLRDVPFEGWRRYAPAVKAALTHPLDCECEECL